MCHALGVQRPCACCLVSVPAPSCLKHALQMSGLQAVLWPRTHLPTVFTFVSLGMPYMDIPSLATIKLS